MSQTQSLTDLVHRRQGGDHSAAEFLFRSAAKRLRRISSALLARDRQAQEVTPSDLVQECFAKKFASIRGGRKLTGSEHFFAVMRRGMQQVLIDSSRVRNAAKRQIPAECTAVSVHGNYAPPLDLAAAVSRLERLDARAYRILRYRSDYGMTWEEISAETGIDPKQARDDYQFAIHWLRHQLGE